MSKEEQLKTRVLGLIPGAFLVRVRTNEGGTEVMFDYKQKETGEWLALAPLFELTLENKDYLEFSLNQGVPLLGIPPDSTGKIFIRKVPLIPVNIN